MEIAARTIERLKSAVGAKGFSEDPSEIAPHSRNGGADITDTRPFFSGPGDRRDFRHPVDLQRDAHAIVPQGGNTGLVGAQIPLEGEILLSLARMNRIRNVDVGDMSGLRRLAWCFPVCSRPWMKPAHIFR